MAAERTDRLIDAMRDNVLVRFERRFEAGHVTGYVLGVGPKFFLLQLVSDRIRYDGFECFRISDVRGLRPDPYAAFVETALAIRYEPPPLRPTIDLSNIQTLIATAATQFPLVSVHSERVDPDVCQIGRPVGMRAGRLSLLEINPGADWDNQPIDHELKSITRVSFGADYEEALYLVGGEPSVQSPA
jgi:hypothetical protein